MSFSTFNTIGFMGSIKTKVTITPTPSANLVSITSDANIITTDGIGNTIYIFKTNSSGTTTGTINFSNIVLNPVITVLAVGGGGGGANGGGRGGGGGGGGVVYTTYTLNSNTTGTIAVGSGRTRVTNGYNTTLNFSVSQGGIGNIIAYGGGGGNNNASGLAGASGGGAAGALSYLGGAANNANNNLGYPGGNAGNIAGGGGGGAGGPGYSGAGTTSGAGGIGFLCNITGSNLYWAGGGGGSCTTGTGGAGGLGGGGGGLGKQSPITYAAYGGQAYSNSSPDAFQSGGDNTGGGGAGGGSIGGSSAQHAGSGILIILIPTASIR